MAYRTEKTATGVDIVIDGFEDGIAESPYDGVSDIRNANIIGVPGEASVNFATTAITQPPTVSAVSFTGATSDVVTVSSTTGYYNGMALIVNSYSGTGLTAGNVYYVGTISGNTFKFYADRALSSVIDITGAGTGTITAPQLGTVTFTSVNLAAQFRYVIDSNGRAWQIVQVAYTGPGGTVPINTLLFLGNGSGAGGSGTPALGNGAGICSFKGYIFVFRDTAIDYMSESTNNNPNTAWIYGWQSVTTAPEYHMAIAAQDDAMYFCNQTRVGSVLENAGSTFDPASGGTYTYNAAALQLPTTDRAVCLSELGTSLLVGGVRSFVYPWDRISTSYNYPIVVPETYIWRIVSTNSNAFVFAGNRGRIYVTNGANIELFLKFPDHVSGEVNPYYVTGADSDGFYGDAIYSRNQLYFSYKALKNDGTVLTTVGGIWGIDIDSKSGLRLEQKMSYGSYAGQVTCLFPSTRRVSPAGLALYGCWTNSGTFGIDVPSTSPYTNYETYIDTDYLPIGTYLNPSTDAQVEFKLAAPMVAGETLKISYRQQLTDNFTLMTGGGSSTSSSGIFSGAGTISGFNQVNFQKSQWIQLRVEYSSTASTPSFTRLKELRIR